MTAFTLAFMPEVYLDVLTRAMVAMLGVSRPNPLVIAECDGGTNKQQDACCNQPSKAAQCLYRPICWYITPDGG